MSHPWMATLRSGHINKDSVRPLFTNSRPKSSQVTQWLPEYTSHPVVYDQMYVSLWVHYITYQHSISFDNNVTMCVIIKVCFWCSYIIINLFCPCLWPVAGFLESESSAIKLATDLCPDCASPRTSPGRASRRSLPGQMKQAGFCVFVHSLPGFNKPKLGYVHDNWLGRWFRFNPCVKHCQRTKSSKNDETKKKLFDMIPWLEIVMSCECPNHIQSWDEKTTAPELWD